MKNTEIENLQKELDRLKEIIKEAEILEKKGYDNNILLHIAFEQDKERYKYLLGELDKLGIINIEADSGLSVELAKTAIDIVKSVNLDFTNLAKMARQKRAAILNEE